MSHELPTPDPLDREAELREFNFILKLAGDVSLPDSEIISGIVTTLKKLQPQSSFPDMLDILDPGTFHSETKLMTDAQKERLNLAIDTYIAEATK